MGKYFKIAMFVSSFLPLWITIGFIDVLNIIRKEENLYVEIIGVSAIVILLFLSFIIIKSSIKNVNEYDYEPYKILEVIQEKGITSEFLLSYVLPLFAFDFTMWEGVVQFLIYFFVLLFLCVRNNNVYANIIFEILGYKFYACELKYIPEPDTTSIQVMIISKANLCANKGNSIEIAVLNKPFYLKKN